jgi:SAM-dependent methyltransferase/uncharacterized protein YbaR (Trm112 family)
VALRRRRPAGLKPLALLMELVCPRDNASLELFGDTLQCPHDHEYPFVEGIPVLVLDDAPPTQPGYWASPGEVEEVRAREPGPVEGDRVDPYVARLIIGTHGNLYRDLAAGLPRYPIPDFPLQDGGARLLDIGCNWGRWSLAAAAKGYDVVGLDPSFEAIVAAQRIATQLRASPRYVVADARFLPFSDASFDVVFSFGVLQHLYRTDVARCVREIARVLAPGGLSYVQMPGAFGPRNLFQLARRGFQDANDFDVRYWTPRDLLRTFQAIGPTRLSANAFLTLNAQSSDIDLLPRRYRMLVRASEGLAALTRYVPLTWLADSLYVVSERR